MRGSFRAIIPSEVGKEKVNDKNDAVFFADRRSLRLSPLQSKATSLYAREAFQTIFPLKRDRYTGVRLHDMQGLRLRDMFALRTRYAPKAHEGPLIRGRAKKAPLRKGRFGAGRCAITTIR